MAACGWEAEGRLCLRRPCFWTLRSAWVCGSLATIVRERSSAMRHLENRFALTIVAFAATLLASCSSNDPCALNGKRVTWGGRLTYSDSDPFSSPGGFFLKINGPNLNNTAEHAALYKSENVYTAFIKDDSQAAELFRLRKPDMSSIDIVGIWRGSAGNFSEECGLPLTEGKFFEIEEIITQ